MTEEQFAIASAEASFYARKYYPLISPETRGYIGLDDLRQMGIIKASVSLQRWDPMKAKLRTFFSTCIQNYYRTVVRDSFTFGRDAALPTFIPAEGKNDDDFFVEHFVDTRTVGAETRVVSADNIDKLLAAASADLGLILRDYFTGDLDHYCASALKRHRAEVAALIETFHLTPDDFLVVAGS